MKVIQNYLFGWEELEPTLLACIARGMNVLLLGSHGSGKTSFARFVSSALSDDENFRFIKYSMDKENLLSMVGCPNPVDLKAGKLNYATHERSIFNADVILLDEITRAGKENQNMVLEILEERTVFGQPLKYRFAIATANEETYRGAYKLDAALLDRFVAVLPIPSTDTPGKTFGADEIRQMLALNQGKRNDNLTESNKQLQSIIDKIRKAAAELQKNKEVMENINDFASKFFAMFLSNLKAINTGSKDKIKVSFRQIADHFVKLTITIAGYYKAIAGEEESCLQKGALDAIRYSLVTKLGIPIDKVETIYEQLKDLLVDGDTLIQRIKVNLTTGSIGDRITTLEKFLPKIKAKFDFAEVTTVIGNLLLDIEITDDASRRTNLPHLFKVHTLLSTNDLSKEALCKTKMRLFDEAVKAKTLVSF